MVRQLQSKLLCDWGLRSSAVESTETVVAGKIQGGINTYRRGENEKQSKEGDQNTVNFVC